MTLHTPFLCKGIFNFRIKLCLFQSDSPLYNEGVSSWLTTRALRPTRVTVINARSVTDDDGGNEVMGDHVSASPREAMLIPVTIVIVLIVCV